MRFIDYAMDVILYTSLFGLVASGIVLRQPLTIASGIVMLASACKISRCTARLAASLAANRTKR